MLQQTAKQTPLQTARVRKTSAAGQRSTLPQNLLHNRLQHPPCPRHGSVPIETPAHTISSYEPSNHHLPRPGIKAPSHPSDRAPAGRAAIFAIPPRFCITLLTFADAKHAVVQHRHQRSTLPTSSQVPRPKVTHHRHAQPLRNHRSLTHLPRTSQRRPKILVRRSLVIYRLPVTPHQLSRHPKLLLRLRHRLRIHRAQAPVTAPAPPQRSPERPSPPVPRPSRRLG